MSIGLEVIRQGGPEAVASKLQTVEGSIPLLIRPGPMNLSLRPGQLC